MCYFKKKFWNSNTLMKMTNKLFYQVVIHIQESVRKCYQNILFQGAGSLKLPIMLAIYVNITQ